MPVYGKHIGPVTGSHTKLEDGSAYLRGIGSISITTGSDGSVSISSTGSEPGGSDTQVQFNDGGALGGDPEFTYNKTTNALTSSFVVATAGFSGSLTKLTDGTSYLRAGDNISVTTGSTGAVTVAFVDTFPTIELNEQVSFSQTLGVWYGTLAYTPSPTTSLMLFHNGQLLTQGALADYTLVGATVQIDAAVSVSSTDRFFAMYKR